jgi:nitrate reductase gamma subunit
VPFHYGITVILLAHLLAALFPGAAGWLLGGQIRRLVLELTGMALGLYALFGLIVLIIRRLAPKSLAQADNILHGRHCPVRPSDPTGKRRRRRDL